MAQRRLKHLTPSVSNLNRIKRRYFFLHRMAQVALLPLFRVTTSGYKNIPRKEPFLLLSNHVGFWDPPTLMLAINRPIQFLATESGFQKMVLGKIMVCFGVIPKRKFASDIGAIRNLKTWCECGAVVGLFPEGQRTWDGRTQSIIPGIARLIRILKVPVVTARIINGDLQSPRWAVKQRSTHIHVELDPPRTFSPKANIKELEELIQKNIYVDPEKCPRWPVSGKNLALGITNVLFMCPACFSLETLDEHGNDLTCRHCNRHWTVESDNNVISHKTGIKTSLLTLLDRMREHIKQQNGTADLKRFKEEGVILESEEMELMDMTGEYPSTVGHGRLLLTEKGLHLVGPVTLSIPFTDLVVATVDFRRQLQFRTTKRLFEAVMPKESVVKWDWFVNHWLSLVQRWDK